MQMGVVESGLEPGESGSRVGALSAVLVASLGPAPKNHEPRGGG